MPPLSASKGKALLVEVFSDSARFVVFNLHKNLSQLKQYNMEHLAITFR
jgi:hypothetical protein